MREDCCFADAIEPLWSAWQLHIDVYAFQKVPPYSN